MPMTDRKQGQTCLSVPENRMFDDFHVLAGPIRPIRNLGDNKEKLITINPTCPGFLSCGGVESG